MIFLNTAAFLFAMCSVAVADEPKTDTVGGLPVIVYPVSSILDGMNKPPAASDAIGEIPAHLQYTVCLDQAGIIDKETGLGKGDPEAAVTLSGGVFDTEERGWWWNKKKVTVQKFNRCNGGGWAFHYENITDFGEGKGSVEPGYAFFNRINAGDEENCYLTFEWNDDYTRAKITGYMSERLRFLPGGVADSAVHLAIELTPYWKWKYGMVVTEKEATAAKELDEKCCPPKEDQSCLGGGKLGKPNTSCETISSACGNVKEDAISDCAMWHRKNYLGVVELKDFSYFGYPIGDKNRDPTPFNTPFQKATTSVGIENVFHGVAPGTDKPGRRYLRTPGQKN